MPCISMVHLFMPISLFGLQSLVDSVRLVIFRGDLIYYRVSLDRTQLYNLCMFGVLFVFG